MKSPFRTSAHAYGFVALFVIVVFLGSCNHPAGPDPATAIKASSSGCIPNSGFKVAKTSASADTNFGYVFSSSVLDVIFTVRQYCGREENSFTVTHSVVGDTITITVTDTIRGGPWCDCLYLVNAQISGLSWDRYIVRCLFFSPDRPAGELWHEVEVRRG